jgi:peroxisomal 3,2-trans-enoyl-CoA isomerase
MESVDKLIVTSLEKGVLTIRVDNQKKKNSLTNNMTRKFVQTMEEALKNDEVKVIYFTSTGEMFSSGNDFNNFSEGPMDEMIKGFEGLIEYLIKYPKVLVAGVNGPAIGMTFTMLFLFDFVLCSDTAFFTAPFMQTYQTPEGCSSVTFPLMLGKSMASHLLINGGVMNASEAKNLGFVTNVYEKEFFEKDAYDYALKVAAYPLKNLMKIKNMINRNFTNYLLKINKEECKELRESWNQKEFQSIIRKFVKNPKF